jgi:glycosyltransferase involved in cell wall biosynthesis
MLRHRPGGIIVQSPSVVLAFWAVLMKRIFGYALIVDAHNEGISPFNRKLDSLQFIYRFIQRGADLTLVTNERLAEVIRRNKGVPFILQDKLPTFHKTVGEGLKGKYNLVCISTFAPDEPYHEVIEAVRELGPDYVVYFTGNHRKLSPETLKKLPTNAVLTGYLPEEAYLGLLKGCDAIIDLTYMEDCLVCGAYEAVALEKPIILTDTPALRKYFCMGAVYTQNKSSDIKNAVMAAINHLQSLSTEIKVLKSQLTKDWLERAKILMDRMNNLLIS